MSLQQFLNQNPIDNLTDEVIISERLMDESGQYFKFKIKSMNNTDYENARKKAMSISAKKGGEVEFDIKKYNETLVVNFTLDPNFKDAASISELGCITPEQYLNKVLLPGEIQNLAGKILILSGFKEMPELIEEAKN